jgi:hypothetical protein
MRCSEDQEDLPSVQGTLVTLIQRSRTSRARKPLSIRSAMQQSAAYASLSRSTSSTNPAARPLGQRGYHTPQSSMSKQHDLSQGVSPMTADLYDRATSATASRDPVSDKARRKRPAFLALNTDDLDNQSEAARYQQSRKDREHLRRSSPTVGENLTLPEGASDTLARPLPNQNPQAAHQPSVQNGTMSGSQNAGKSNGTYSSDEEDYDEDDEDILEQHLEDPPIPPPENLDHPATSQSALDRLSSITEEAPQPKRQKSTSSVRSQIIALPETARLRKQASGEHVRQASPTTTAPSVPSIKPTSGRGASQEPIRRRQSDLANRYQSSEQSNLAFRTRQKPSRSASQDGRPHPTIPLPAPPQEAQYARAVSPTHGTRPISPTLSTGVRSPTSPPGPGEETWPLTPDMVQYMQHSRTISEDPSFPALRSLSPDSITPRPSRSGTPLFSNTPYSNTPYRSRSRSNTAMGLQDDPSSEHFNDAASIAASSIAPSLMSAQWFSTPRDRLGLGGRITNRAEAAPWEPGGDVDDDDGPQYYYDGTHQKQPQRSRKVQLFSIYPPKDPSSAINGTAPELPPRSPLLTDQFLTGVRGLPDDLSPRQQQALHPLRHVNNASATYGASMHSASVNVAPLLHEGVPQHQYQGHQFGAALQPQDQSLHQQQQQLPQERASQSTDDTPHRTLSLRSLALRRSGSRAEGKVKDSSSNRPVKKSSKGVLGEMAKEYKSLTDKWYSGQYEDEYDDHEIEEQIQRMREDDAAYARERARHMPRPSTSAGIFMTHETGPQMAKEPTAQHPQHQVDPTGVNGIAQSAAYGQLRSRASRETDSTMSSFQTGSGRGTSASQRQDKTGRTFSPPATARSATSSSSSKSKKSKKKKKGGFWSALREESKAISNNWYTNEETTMASRAGSA